MAEIKSGGQEERRGERRKERKKKLSSADEYPSVPLVRARQRSSIPHSFPFLPLFFARYDGVKEEDKRRGKSMQIFYALTPRRGGGGSVIRLPFSSPLRACTWNESVSRGGWIVSVVGSTGVYMTRTALLIFMPHVKCFFSPPPPPLHFRLWVYRSWFIIEF